jgi:hypothetical protein
MEHRPQFTSEQVEWLCDLIDDWHYIICGKICGKNDTVTGFEFAKDLLKDFVTGRKKLDINDFIDS